jgi:hypothetical protein
MRQQAVALLGTLAILTAASSAAHAGSGITWTVLDRFPLLEVEDFRRLEGEWTLARSQSMWHFIRHRLGQPRGKSEYLLVEPPPETAWRGAVMRTSYAAELKAPSGSAGCAWSVNGIQVASTDCTLTHTFVRGQSTPVTVKFNGGEATANVLAQDVVVVAMGDSYASGEGSPDRPAIYPDVDTPHTNEWFRRRGKGVPLETVKWHDPVCHRSLVSWPVLAALRLALEHPHAIVRLVNVSCSGATFLDGYFLAQEKDPPKPLRQALSSEQNGRGIRNPKVHPNQSMYLPLSQANEIRHVLCKSSGAEEDVSLPGRPYHASFLRCDEALLRPDVLLMTGGGNDANFADAIGGALVPADPRKGRPLAPAFLGLMRWVGGYIDPETFARKLDKLAPDYPAYLATASRAAMVRPDQTVLVRYPNPLTSQGGSCSDASTLRQHRIKASFMAFGPVANELSPAPASWFINGWTVWIGSNEVKSFLNDAFPALQRMQSERLEGLPFKAVDWIPSSEDPNESFATRLLCTDEKVAEDWQYRMTLEPFYFCEKYGPADDECVPDDPRADAPKSVIQRHAALSSWSFWAPKKRFIQSTNESLLAQRSWKNSEPSKQHLMGAISGTFHPSPEAFAAAADSAYRGLCDVLARDRPGLCKSTAASKATK